MTRTTHSLRGRRAFFAMARSRPQRGVALVDLIVATAVFAVLTGISLPTIDALRDRAQVRAAAMHLAAQFQSTRSEALSRNVCLAFRVSEDRGRYTLTLYADGDGDGVSELDIDAGTDIQLSPGASIDQHFQGVLLNVPADVPEIDGGGRLRAGSAPVRIGRSRLITFTPLGNTTSGTLYLSAGAGTQAAVRLLGATGRIRALWFDSASQIWRE